jgi:Cu2+-exporting ATPase
VTSSLRVVGGLDHDQEDAPERSLLTTTLVVDNMQCGGCMASIERALRATPGVAEARANLSARRVTVVSDAVDADVQTLIESLDRAGFRAAEAIDRNDTSADERAHALLRRLGVAGFAAANVMLLSVSVWAGVASDMDHAAQGLFHWLSALIAMPAIAYSAQPFFSSAATALKARRLNMDVPISLGITLATAMSLFQTIRGTEHVYFDAAIMLTFFLLIGRYLDELVRVRARGAAENLLGLKALAATVIGIDGLPRRLSARALEPGMRVQVAAGERIPVDGKIIAGETEIDASLITGETIPAPARIGSVVHAGTLNLGQPIMVEATATDDNTLVAEIARLMVAAEQGRGHYVRLADRAARLYSPVVHILGAATFIGWMLAGAGWEHALTCAIAVLIITCPCALALAVPAVQVAATSRLFAKGIIVKAADGLERLSEIDTVVFDKTGTLTRGEPSLKNASAIDTGVLARAAALAVSSRHPYALAVVKAARERGLQVRPENGVTESPGSGLMATDGTGHERRLGSMAWVLGDGIQPQKKEAATLWYAETGSAPVGFEFDDAPKTDAGKVVGALREAGFAIELLSGDREHAVQKAARAVGISRWFAGVRPDGKIARITALGDAGRRVLMVGDGLNDAPALAAAHASLSPSSAADISQNAADAVFQGDKLEPVLEALGVAQAAQRMAVQNFGIAIAYNIVSVPLAMAGHVTPLIAALAMSFSSIAVTGNALRLRSSKVGLARVERQSSGGKA